MDEVFGSLLFSAALCLFLIGTVDPSSPSKHLDSTSCFKPLAVVRTKDGISVTIFGPPAFGVGDRSPNETYFFSPSAILRRSSVMKQDRDHNNNKAISTNKLCEVRFDVELWSDTYCDEISSLTGIPRTLLSIYPFDSVELVMSIGQNEQDPANRYTLPKSQVFHGPSARPRTLHFAVAGNRCMDDSKTTSVALQLHFRNDSAVETVDVAVSLSKHVIPTAMFRKIQEKGDPEILLTEKAVEDFVDQVADEVLKKGSMNGSLEFAAPDVALEAIRTGLFEKQIGNSSLVIPDTKVILAESEEEASLEPAADGWFLRGGRIERVKRRTINNNLAMKASSGEQKQLMMMMTTTNGTSTKRSSFLHHPNNSIRHDSKLFYIVNVSKMAANEMVATVRVLEYPSEAIVRFPVSIVADAVYHYSKPTMVALCVLQLSWVVVPLLFLASLTHVIRQHRRRKVKNYLRYE